MKLPKKRQLWRYYLLAYYTIKYLVFRFNKWQHPKPLKVIYGALIGITTVSFLYLSVIVAAFAFITGLAFFIIFYVSKFTKDESFERGIITSDGYMRYGSYYENNTDISNPYGHN